MGFIAITGALTQLGCLLILVAMAQDLIRSDAAQRDEPIVGLGLLLFFCLLLAIAAGLKMLSLAMWARLSEEISNTLIRNTITQISNASLTQLETTGASTITSRLTMDVKTLGAGLWSLLAAIQTMTFLVGTLVALLYFAFEEALIISLFTLIKAFLLTSLNKKLTPTSEVVSRADDLFQSRLHDVVTGFRDLAMDPLKVKSFVNRDLAPASTFYRRTRSIYSQKLSLQTIVFWIYIYGTIGFIIFIGPEIGISENVIIISGIYFYLIDRVELLTAQIPLIGLGEGALERIQTLSESFSVPKRQVDENLTHFHQIKLQGVHHHYRDQDGQIAFTLGPVDLTLESGKIYLIQGGNGSGKSSLMKVLTGLYVPDEGQILVDGQVLPIASRQSLFSAVFTDFWLFQALHGLHPLNTETIQARLQELSMDHKVHLNGNAFSTTDLSTGQRKRLALVAALEEQRPIIVLDEWTADQDPHFRSFFFRTLLPRLREQGMTVIAVTHDDQYFDCGDWLIRLETGQIVEIKAIGQSKGDSL